MKNQDGQKFEERYIGHAGWWDCYIKGTKAWKNKDDAINEIMDMKKICGDCEKCSATTTMVMVEI